MIVDSAAHRVVRVDAHGRSVVMTADLDYPRTITWSDPDGAWLVSDRTGLHLLNPAVGPCRLTPDPNDAAGPLTRLRDVLLHGKRLYLADCEKHRLVVLERRKVLVPWPSAMNPREWPTRRTPGIGWR